MQIEIVSRPMPIYGEGKVNGTLVDLWLERGGDHVFVDIDGEVFQGTFRTGSDYSDSVWHLENVERRADLDRRMIVLEVNGVPVEDLD